VSGPQDYPARAMAGERVPEPDRARLDAATAGLEPPFAVVDLDAYDANAADLLRRAGGKPLRLASKSVRCRALQDRALDAGFCGQLCFTLPEALWLAGHGARDLLVAYPTTDRTALRALAHGEHVASVTVMVDAVAHLDLIESAAAGGAPVRVAIDVDASWRALGGRLHVGVRRSPVHSAAGAAALARAIVARPGLRLVGLMSYEAQIAGLGDHPPGRPWRGAVLRAVQRASARELAARRAAVVAAVRAVAPLELVNGGGTGSVEATAAEAAVTEVTAGSGLYGPTLFDAYGAFRPRPAALFALPVVRRPSARRATLLGGGYLASGAPGADRLPRPFLPRGLRLDRREGAGEVQTPVAGAVADALAVGDRVWLRHAKAGELCERFAELHLVRGDHVIGTVPTYRGEGRTFL
jgi:D-serine deaminase-like pyridoxal phosphate-dependent protein